MHSCAGTSAFPRPHPSDCMHSNICMCRVIFRCFIKNFNQNIRPPEQVKGWVQVVFCVLQKRNSKPSSTQES